MRYGGVKLLLPGYTLYPVMAYAFGGCLVLALVLPIIAWRDARRRPAAADATDSA